MLIHIGKCGGSNITYKFKDYYNICIPFKHISKPSIINCDHVCILLRDPITRFISIFYYRYNLYEKYINGINIPHKKNMEHIKYIFNYFKTPNELAEALSDNKLKNIAKKV